jgi:hypothetical protein
MPRLSVVLTRHPPQYSSTTRESVRRRLVQSGIADDEAAGWCDLWLNEAIRTNVAVASPYFWDMAKGWIDAQRSFAAMRNRVVGWTSGS